MLKHIVYWGISLLSTIPAFAQNGIYSKESTITISGNSQVYVNGGYFNVDSTSAPSFSSMLDNNGHLYLTGDFINYSKNVVSQGDSGYIHFTGDSNQYISNYFPDSLMQLNYVEINKGNGNVYLTSDLFLKRELNFQNGHLILQEGNLLLNKGLLTYNGIFVNEWENSRVQSTYGEEVKIIKYSVTPGEINGVGLHVNETFAGKTDISRGHNRQFSAGDGGIHRYFKFSPSNATTTDLRMDYFNAEVDTLIETELDIWHSSAGITWRPQFGTVDPAMDTSFLSYSTINSGGVYTLAEQNCRNHPIVEFGSDTIYVCQGDSVTLDLQHSGQTYQWSTGATSQNISVKTAGTYYGTTYDISNCYGTDTVEIIVAPIPSAKFDFNDLVVCENDTAFLSDSSTIDSGFVASWKWDFGVTDSISDTSNLQNPAYLFPVYGSYNVRLIVNSGVGCSDTAFKSRIIAPLPEVGFLSTDTLCEGSSVSFTDTSSIPMPYGFVNSWDFGDGFGAPNAPAVSHTYSGTGSFLTKLLVTSNTGCVDSAFSVVTIHQNPTADFSFDRPCSNEPVQFTNNSNLAYNNQWYFGDGDSSVASDPQHLYPSHGSYVVALHVASVNGCTDDSVQTVYIDTIPNVSFSFDTVCEGSPVLFTNNTTLQSGIMNYSWDFGDGNSSILPSPSHIYSSPGSYPVQLTANSSYGCSDSLTRLLKVHPNPNAAFNVSNVCFNDFISLNNTSAIPTGTMNWNWSMGDGNSYITQHPTHLYNLAGNYEIVLEVTSDYGCKDTVSDSVSVFDLPFINLGDTITTCSSYFLLDAQNAGSSYLWSDNSSSQTLNVTNNGYYSVEITNPNGCKASDTVYVLLNTLVAPDLGADRTVCNSEILNVFQPGSSYQWQDGSSNSSMTAASTGTYWVTLTDQNGCVGYDTVQLTINASPIVQLGNDTLLCSADSVLLDAQNPGATYLWSTGQSSQSIYQSFAGITWVQVTGTNGCATRDSVMISIENNPSISLPDTSVFCGSGVLSPVGNAVNWLWSTGSTLTSLAVSSSGTYSVTGFSPSGCPAFDTTYVSVLPIPTVSLGNDTTLCNSDSLQLNASAGSSSNLWSNGDTGTSIMVYSTGLYWVETTGFNGCAGRDSVTIVVNPPLVVELGNDVRLCGDGVSVFEANYPGTPSWYWNGIFAGNDSIVQTDTSGTLILSVDWNGCADSDTIEVITPIIPLTADFLIPSTVNVGDTVQIVQVSYPQPVTEQVWDLGFGIVSTEKHPSIVYYIPGTYTIQLVVGNGNCVDTLVKTIEVVNQQPSEPLTPEETDKIVILESKVYPNPTNGELTLETLLNESSKITIRLFDFNGRMILLDDVSGKELQKTFNLSSLEGGMYFMVLNTRDHQFTHKIVLY